MTALANALRAAGITCPYCGKSAKKIEGVELYPFHQKLRTLTFWRCDPCEAHVGCHPNSSIPLGTLAKKPLRALRTQAHHHFDGLRESKEWGRTFAYAWLATKMELPRDKCHIAWMDEGMCLRVIDICRTETENMYAEI